MKNLFAVFKVGFFLADFPFFLRQIAGCTRLGLTALRWGQHSYTASTITLRNTVCIRMSANFNLDIT